LGTLEARGRAISGYKNGSRVLAVASSMHPSAFPGTPARSGPSVSGDPGAPPSSAPPPGASQIRPPGWPAIAVFALAFVLTAASSTMLVFLVALVRTGGERAKLPAAAVEFALSASGLMAVAIVNAVVLTAVAFAAARIAGDRPVGAQLRLGATRASPLGLVAVCAGILGLGFACGAARELLHLHGASGMEALAESLENPTAGRFVAALITIGVVPGFAEETFFRGFLQTRLAASWGRWPAIIVAAVAFGLIHVDPVQGSVAFVAGVFFGWVVERVGGVRPSILAHVTNNVVFVSVAAFSSSGPAAPTRQIAILAIGSGLCVAAVLVLRSSRALD
jgi:membrane protease YdiL (CAAX protease family)